MTVIFVFKRMALGFKKSKRRYNLRLIGTNHYYMDYTLNLIIILIGKVWPYNNLRSFQFFTYR